jgi:hypothetical protein
MESSRSPLVRDMNDGRQAIGINRKQRGEIAGPVAHHAQGAAYRILAAGEAVEIAHWLPANGSLGMLAKRRRAPALFVNLYYRA